MLETTRQCGPRGSGPSRGNIQDRLTYPREGRVPPRPLPVHVRRMPTRVMSCNSRISWYGVPFMDAGGAALLRPRPGAHRASHDHVVDTNLKTGIAMPQFIERDGRFFVCYCVN